MANNVIFQSATPSTPPDGTIAESIDVGAGVQRQVVQVEPGTAPLAATVAKGATAFTDPTCDTTADLILAANANRKAAIIQNAGTVDCFVGPSGVTTTSGLSLVAGATFIDDASVSAWYGITAAGTADLRVCEVT